MRTFTGHPLLCYLFDASTSRQHKTRRKKARSHDEQQLLCVFCHHPITTDADRIPVNASHEHICVNPAGVEYRIGCFDQAPGCADVGPSTMEHTWFAGHRWQIAVCGHCHQHLGWSFRNGSRFYGLIINRLKAS